METSDQPRIPIGARNTTNDQRVRAIDVSVIIAAYDPPETFRRALQAFAYAQNGAGPSFEVVVVDNHPERTSELALVLRRWIEEGDSTRATAGELVIDDAARQELNALGYTGD